VKPEGSLMHSQVTATYTYTEPVRSSPYPHITPPEDPDLYYPPIYTCVSQVVSFPQVSTPKYYIHLSSHAACMVIVKIPFFNLIGIPDRMRHFRIVFKEFVFRYVAYSILFSKYLLLKY